METKIWAVTILACITFFSACSNKSESEIESETSSGVVLIQNKSYYEVVLPNNKSFYFSSLDENNDIKGLDTDENTVERTISYGTGFFISDEGEIATNSHVVSSSISDKDINKSVSSLFGILKKYISREYDELRKKFDEVKELYEYANKSDEVSYEDFYKVRDLRDEIKEELDEYSELIDNISEMRASNSEIKYHCQISVAYNNTHVTEESDFISCVVLNTDREHDLAIIQLKDKMTPTGKFIFTVENEDPLETYSLKEKITNYIGEDKNAKLYMQSFNLGPQLAITKNGIRSQFNYGSISQKTSDRLMYSIPTLPGSSGSPVVNQQGQLVAINYAGLQGTQSFNYGIRVKYLYKLLENKNED